MSDKEDLMKLVDMMSVVVDGSTYMKELLIQALKDENLI